MRIGVAQFRAKKGDVPANVVKHKACIKTAADQQVNALFFPELSLTGFEPSLAPQLAVAPDDEILDDFQVLSDKHHMVIGVGMPIRLADDIHISMVIFQPNKKREVHSKQFLPEKEAAIFTPGTEQVMISLDYLRIAPAICYESMQVEHAQRVHRLGANVYATSVAKSAEGVQKAMDYYQQLAMDYTFPVLMSNFIGPCELFTCAGGSAVINQHGECLAQMSEQEEGVLAYDFEAESVL